jgi:endonuclease/exonuclease/phosphatase family metal-dependent hydrolase
MKHLYKLFIALAVLFCKILTIRCPSNRASALVTKSLSTLPSSVSFYSASSICTPLLLTLAFLASTSTLAAELKFASWNLGWHISNAELAAWIDACGKRYARGSDGLWQQSEQETAQVGWDISEYRSRIAGLDMTKMPPCSVYRADGMKGNLAVTPTSHEKRLTQLAQVLKKEVNADVIAFQEVSGTQAVREALGDAASEYTICSFDNEFKVQRLAFAWRKSKFQAVGNCVVHREIALTHLPPEQQLRPALSVTLRAGNTTYRLLTLHLKSGCVSALDGGQLDAAPKARSLKGAKKDDPCPMLQQQIAPLETVFETLAQGVDHFMVVGDFNRNLWHEMNAPDQAIRANNTDPTSALTNTTTNNLYRELNDGVPLSSKATLVKLSCPVDAETQALCDYAAKAPLKGADKQRLVSSRALGCRNGVGLDHFLISDTLKAKVAGAEKIAIGRFGRSQGPTSARSEPLLGVSDHCPIVLRINNP